MCASWKEFASIRWNILRTRRPPAAVQQEHEEQGDGHGHDDRADAPELVGEKSEHIGASASGSGLVVRSQPDGSQAQPDAGHLYCCYVWPSIRPSNEPPRAMLSDAPPNSAGLSIHPASRGTIAPVHRRDPALLTLWISLCVWLVAGGWLLSLFGALDAAGYLALLAGFLCFWRAVLFQPGVPLVDARRWRRGRAPFSVRAPDAADALRADDAGHLRARRGECRPRHDDGLCYRIPRVLHWLHAGGWHWIAAEDVRLNARGTVAEWLFAPLLLFSRSDRLLFLPNWISHLFLPGLVYSTWRQPGRFPPRRLDLDVAAAFGVLFQSCRPAMPATTAWGRSSSLAVHLPCYPRRGQAPTFRAVALAVLALALMSGTKPNLAPLGLAFAVVFIPSLARFLSAVRWLPARLAWWRCWVSFVPNALFNYVHLHDFRRSFAGSLTSRAEVPRQSCFWAISSCWPVRTLAPPLLPFAAILGERAVAGGRTRPSVTCCGAISSIPPSCITPSARWSRPGLGFAVVPWVASSFSC